LGGDVGRVEVVGLGAGVVAAVRTNWNRFAHN
jgi:hypothetical protein